jgi:hypothetical protein
MPYTSVRDSGDSILEALETRLSHDLHLKFHGKIILGDHLRFSSERNSRAPGLNDIAHSEVTGLNDIAHSEVTGTKRTLSPGNGKNQTISCFAAIKGLVIRRRTRVN